MSKKEFLQRHNLVIHFLKRKKATFDEINSFLESESDITGLKLMVSQRTFQRDIEEIRSLYEVEIRCERATGLYYIFEEEESETKTKLLETFDLYNALNLTKGYEEYIKFENRKSIGTEHIYKLIQCIKNKITIEFEYCKFYVSDIEVRKVEPMLIKEFNGRFYLMAFDVNRKDIRTFGLDRIKQISILKTKFKKHMVNWELYYKDAFGIIAPQDRKPIPVILEFNWEEAQYIKSYPLHHSQKVISENKNAVQFELLIHLTYDFVMEILSYGKTVKVLEPLKLKEILKENCLSILKKY